MAQVRDAYDEEPVSLEAALARSGLSNALVAKVLAVPHRLLKADAKRPFRKPGSSQGEAFYVQRGVVSKFKMNNVHQKQITALRFAGEGFLPFEGLKDFGLQAIVPSELIVADAEKLGVVIQKHPEINEVFWKLSQRNTGISYQWLLNCGRRDSIGRVAHLLLETAFRSGSADRDRMINPFTQQHIADIVAQTSVNVSRVFSELERSGIIKRDRRLIIFEDIEELRRLAGFEPTYLQ